MMRQPFVEAGEDRDRALLTCGKAGHRILPPDIGLDGIESSDKAQALFGDWGRTGAGDLDQFAPSVGPAIGKLDVRTNPVGSYQAVVACIAIDLENAAVALQNPLGMLPTAARRIGEGHAWWSGAAPRPIIARHGPEVTGLCLA